MRGITKNSADTSINRVGGFGMDFSMVEKGFRASDGETSSTIGCFFWRRKRRSRAISGILSPADSRCLSRDFLLMLSMSCGRICVFAFPAVIYLRCRGAGRVLLGKAVRSTSTFDGGIGNDANSLAPSAIALSATNRCSTEYWFLKNSWISALYDGDQHWCSCL